MTPNATGIVSILQVAASKDSVRPVPVEPPPRARDRVGRRRTQRVGGSEFFREECHRSRIGELGHPRVRRHEKVMTAVRTDLERRFQFALGQEMGALLAAFALAPEQRGAPSS